VLAGIILIIQIKEAGLAYSTPDRNTRSHHIEFLDKTSPLRTLNKLGGILFQLPPSFTVGDFKNIEQFLDRLTTADGYDYSVEFRHPSRVTNGPWEMLKHYNIAAVMTDSPRYLSWNSSP
jgi:uncharacterized protein YecE (DUF72 family)